MKKQYLAGWKGVAAALWLVSGIGFVYAQENQKLGSLDITIDMKFNALEVEATEFSDSDLRPGQNQHGATFVKPGPITPDATPGNPKAGQYLTADASAKFGFYGEQFGGYFIINLNGMGGAKAWLQFGDWVRLTAGSDNKSIYADPLGADPELRVYNGTTAGSWNSSINPDNITQDAGVLLEGFFGPVTVALSGNFHDGKSVFIDIPNTNSTKWLDSEDRSFLYGARVGSRIGSIGTANASYFVRYARTGSKYRSNAQQELAATDADAEVAAHHFGLFTSLTPLENLGLTLGYGGILTKYLDEFYRGSVGYVQTTTPAVFQNGVMVNVRYTDIIPGLTLRSDHNFSFWQDKNYNVYGISGLENVGVLSPAQSAGYGDVSHWLLWDGLGASYRLNGRFVAGLYVRNLIRDDSSKTKGLEYRLNRNQFFIEPSLTYTVTAFVSMSVAVNLESTITTASKDLNSQGLNAFVSGVRPKETSDTKMVIRVPVAINMRY